MNNNSIDNLQSNDLLRMAQQPNAYAPKRNYAGALNYSLNSGSTPNLNSIAANQVSMQKAGPSGASGSKNIRDQLQKKRGPGAELFN